MKISFFLILLNLFALSNDWAQDKKIQNGAFESSNKIDKKAPNKHNIHLIFCSDLHYGLTRKFFRNDTNVSASAVNLAMIENMNRLPKTFLPKDGGVGSGEKIQNIAEIIITGDICNRQEPGIQNATQSWQQFQNDYFEKLTLKNESGNNIPILLTPGNHDISNAIGFPRPMVPVVDNSAMVGMFNLEMQPAIPKTTQDFNFQKDKIHYSVNTGGVHFMFVTAWPDSSERVWMQEDLNKVPRSMPSFILTHSDPSPEARFFKNPIGDHSINATDKFENLVEEIFKDGVNVKEPSNIEQQGFATFLKNHPNIKAYFHGHSNFAEFYDWHGPDSTISLPCFRVDSPLKGKISSKDESKLSYFVISIDAESKRMTVRECLWNVNPKGKKEKVEWGIVRSIAL